MVGIAIDVWWRKLRKYNYFLRKLINSKLNRWYTYIFLGYSFMWEISIICIHHDIVWKARDFITIKSRVVANVSRDSRRLRESKMDIIVICSRKQVGRQLGFIQFLLFRVILHSSYQEIDKTEFLHTRQVLSK